MRVPPEGQITLSTPAGIPTFCPALSMVVHPDAESVLLLELASSMRPAVVVRMMATAMTMSRRALIRMLDIPYHYAEP